MKKVTFTPDLHDSRRDSTHNFSILYTNIPQEKLIKRLNSVLDFAV